MPRRLKRRIYKFLRKLRRSKRIGRRSNRFLRKMKYLILNPPRKIVVRHHRRCRHRRHRRHQGHSDGEEHHSKKKKHRRGHKKHRRKYLKCFCKGYKQAARLIVRRFRHGKRHHRGGPGGKH